MKVLFFGDIVGATAVRHLAERIPRWRREYEIDLVVANAENAAVSDPDDINRGFGTPARVVETLFEAGVDVLTGGNHSWDAPDAALVFEHPRVLRPHNVERSLPGHGTVRLAVGLRHVTVVNLITRTDAPSGADRDIGQRQAPGAGAGDADRRNRAHRLRPCR